MGLVTTLIGCKSDKFVDSKDPRDSKPGKDRADRNSSDSNEEENSPSTDSENSENATNPENITGIFLACTYLSKSDQESSFDCRVESKDILLLDLDTYFQSWKFSFQSPSNASFQPQSNVNFEQTEPYDTRFRFDATQELDRDLAEAEISFDATYKDGEKINLVTPYSIAITQGGEPAGSLLLALPTRPVSIDGVEFSLCPLAIEAAQAGGRTLVNQNRELTFNNLYWYDFLSDKKERDLVPTYCEATAGGQQSFSDNSGNGCTCLTRVGGEVGDLALSVASIDNVSYGLCPSSAEATAAGANVIISPQGQRKSSSNNRYWFDYLNDLKTGLSVSSWCRSTSGGRSTYKDSNGDGCTCLTPR